ncbi:MAG: hypothetical protein ACREVA_00045 [Burkholderiales bacterium]
MIQNTNYDYSAYAGLGFDGQSSADMVMPFLTILQALSPQVQNGSLRPGMLLDTVTGEIWDGKEGIPFIPAVTKHSFTEWRPRGAGGGFVGHCEPDSPTVQGCRESQEFGKYVTPSGNDLVETFYVYGILATETARHQVIAFSGSRIKRYRAWMTLARTIQIPDSQGRMIQPPLFAHRYRLRTVVEKNQKGQYYNWDTIGFDGADAQSARIRLDDPLFADAYSLRNVVLAGQANVNYEIETPANGKPVAQTSPAPDLVPTPVLSKVERPRGGTGKAPQYFAEPSTSSMPPMPNNVLEKNWSQWQQSIKNGKTVGALIEFLSQRYSMTQPQIEELKHLDAETPLDEEAGYDNY